MCSYMPDFGAPAPRWVAAGERHVDVAVAQGDKVWRVQKQQKQQAQDAQRWEDVDTQSRGQRVWSVVGLQENSIYRLRIGCERADGERSEYEMLCATSPAGLRLVEEKEQLTGSTGVHLRWDAATVRGAQDILFDYVLCMHRTDNASKIITSTQRTEFQHKLDVSRAGLEILEFEVAVTLRYSTTTVEPNIHERVAVSKPLRYCTAPRVPKLVGGTPTSLVLEWKKAVLHRMALNSTLHLRVDIAEDAGTGRSEQEPSYPEGFTSRVVDLERQGKRLELAELSPGMWYWLRMRCQQPSNEEIWSLSPFVAVQVPQGLPAAPEAFEASYTLYDDEERRARHIFIKLQWTDVGSSVEEYVVQRAESRVDREDLYQVVHRTDATACVLSGLVSLKSFRYQCKFVVQARNKIGWSKAKQLSLDFLVDPSPMVVPKASIAASPLARDTAAAASKSSDHMSKTHHVIQKTKRLVKDYLDSDLVVDDEVRIEKLPKKQTKKSKRKRASASSSSNAPTAAGGIASSVSGGHSSLEWASRREWQNSKTSGFSFQDSFRDYERKHLEEDEALAKEAAYWSQFRQDQSSRSLLTVSVADVDKALQPRPPASTSPKKSPNPYRQPVLRSQRSKKGKRAGKPPSKARMSNSTRHLLAEQEALSSGVLRQPEPMAAFTGSPTSKVTSPQTKVASGTGKDAKSTRQRQMQWTHSYKTETQLQLENHSVFEGELVTDLRMLSEVETQALLFPEAVAASRVSSASQDQHEQEDEKDGHGDEHIQSETAAPKAENLKGLEKIDNEAPVQKSGASCPVSEARKHKSAAQIQSLFRTVKPRKVFREHWLLVTEQKQLAQEREMMQKMLEEERAAEDRAASVLQANVRTFNMRRKTQKEKAAVQIQAQYRRKQSQLILKERKVERVQINIAATRIQRHFRVLETQRRCKAIEAAETREKEKAALRLQKAMRANLKQKAFFAQRQAAIRIQSRFRTHKEQARFEARVQEIVLRAAIRLQTRFRAHHARKHLDQRKRFLIKSIVRVTISRCGHREACGVYETMGVSDAAKYIKTVQGSDNTYIIERNEEGTPMWTLKLIKENGEAVLLYANKVEGGSLRPPKRSWQPVSGTVPVPVLQCKSSESYLREMDLMNKEAVVVTDSGCPEIHGRYLQSGIADGVAQYVLNKKGASYMIMRSPYGEQKASQSFRDRSSPTTSRTATVKRIYYVNLVHGDSNVPPMEDWSIAQHGEDPEPILVHQQALQK
ncbi:Abnormal spindle-like microcephaly-associated protein-like [Durusdinium trenchii]|uniref:Abnormal spindle-like microcephaly-associated protein-like n=1 Tax=Durusdinium trenchii TaxID=1381693 RepID=A0ABP0RUX6_9DINO